MRLGVWSRLGVLIKLLQCPSMGTVGLVHGIFLGAGVHVKL